MSDMEREGYNMEGEGYVHVGEGRLCLCPR